MKSGFTSSVITAMALAISLTASPCGARADSAPNTPVIKLPDDIKFGGLAGAPQTAVLYGDPTKEGLYVSRTKFPAGFKAMPHSHPDSQRTIAVLSGTLYFSTGEVWDESKLQPYPAGTFFTEPAGAPHFAWAKDGDVVVQVTAIGPTGMTPVKPK